MDPVDIQSGALKLQFTGEHVIAQHTHADLPARPAMSEFVVHHDVKLWRVGLGIDRSRPQNRGGEIMMNPLERIAFRAQEQSSSLDVQGSFFPSSKYTKIMLIDNRST